MKSLHKGNQEIYYLDLDEFNLIYDEIFLKEIYAFDSVVEDPFIIDCGSNIGLSILYFKKIYPKAHIIGFEPNPITFQILKQNVESHHLLDVTLINSAVYNVEGKTLCYGSSDPKRPNTISNTLLKDLWLKEFENKNYHSFEVCSEKLSTYLCGPIDFLKIDIEGAEQIVLQEIEHKLKYVKNIFVEFHGTQLNKKVNSLPVIKSILEKAGFVYACQKIDLEAHLPVCPIEKTKVLKNKPLISTIKGRNTRLISA